MSKIELPPVPPRATSKDFPGYAPPEDGNAAEHWAEGFNECRDLIAARDRQIVEVCAQIAEQATHRKRQAAAWANCAPIKPCLVAAAIRNIIEESNNG
jgi:hypothetical protein